MEEIVSSFSTKSLNLDKDYNLINTLNPWIKFTIESSEHRLPLLDILILKNGTITTDIYNKKTDTYQYPNFHSYDISHTKQVTLDNADDESYYSTKEACSQNNRLNLLLAINNASPARIVHCSILLSISKAYLDPTFLLL